MAERSINILEYAPEALCPDTGCQYSTLCKECPLPCCKHDDPHALPRAQKEALRATIVSARDGGATAKEIAGQLGIHTRAVHRALAIHAQKERAEKGVPFQHAMRDIPEKIRKLALGTETSTKDIAAELGVGVMTVRRYMAQALT